MPVVPSAHLARTIAAFTEETFSFGWRARAASQSIRPSGALVGLRPTPSACGRYHQPRRTSRRARGLRAGRLRARGWAGCRRRVFRTSSVSFRNHDARWFISSCELRGAAPAPGRRRGLRRQCYRPRNSPVRSRAFAHLLCSSRHGSRSPDRAQESHSSAVHP